MIMGGFQEWNTNKLNMKTRITVKNIRNMKTIQKVKRIKMKTKMNI